MRLNFRFLSDHKRSSGSGRSPLKLGAMASQISFAALFLPGGLFLLFGLTGTISLQESLVGALFGWGIILCACSLPLLLRWPILKVLGFLGPFYCWYFLRFDQPLPSQMIAMASTAPRLEIMEFLSLEWPGLMLATGCGLVFSLAQKIPEWISKKAMAAAGFGLVSVLVNQRAFAVYFSSSQSPLLTTALISQTYPSTFLGPYLHEKFKERFVAVGATPGQVTVADGVDISVLVIGESARADHWSMNGYERPTTPRISSETIINFPLVRSIGDCTAVTVPAMLTMQGPESRISINGPVNNQPNIVDIYKAAGYYTALVTNQETSDFGRTGSSFDVVKSIFHSDASGFYGKAYDIDMLPEINSILALPVSRKFLIIHLYGSHISYSERYRDEFKIFSDGIVGEYDNSIVATDGFLSALINRLKATGARVALAYSSDHGDDFGDSGKMPRWHCLSPSNKNTLVPLFFWLQGGFPDKMLRNLDENARRYVSQAGVVPALLDLSGVQIDSPLMAQALTRPQVMRVEQLTLDRAGEIYSCTLAGGCLKD